MLITRVSDRRAVRPYPLPLACPYLHAPFLIEKMHLGITTNDASSPIAMNLRVALRRLASKAVRVIHTYEEGESKDGRKGWVAGALI